MNYINIKDLARVDFDVKGVKASSYAFPINIENDYLAEGRQRHLIHIITDGTRIYKTKDEAVTVCSGSLMFLPHGTKYHTVSVGEGNQTCKGISVIFDTVDSSGQPLMLENSHLHVRRDKRGSLIKLCEKMLKCTLDEPDNVLLMKSYLLRLLIEISNDSISNPPPALVPALEMITSRYKENLSVKQYADACLMSESYFRKLFSEHTGRSPIRYRNELRFADARRLFSEGASVREIADELGFFDASYFSRLYKKCNGHSLSDEKEPELI